MDDRHRNIMPQFQEQPMGEKLDDGSMLKGCIMTLIWRSKGRIGPYGGRRT